jgi:hypothetical protein
MKNYIVVSNCRHLLVEFELDLLFFILQLLLQLCKALIDVFHLLELESVQLLFDLINELLIFFVESVRIDKHFLEIEHVLLETVGHLLYLDELVTVVLVEHALYANCDAALLAEVLNRLVGVSGAEDKVALRSLEHHHVGGKAILDPLQNGNNLLVFYKLGRICRLNLGLTRGAGLLHLR